MYRLALVLLLFTMSLQNISLFAEAPYTPANTDKKSKGIKYKKEAKKNLKLADDLWRKGKYHESIDYYKAVLSIEAHASDIYCLHQIAEIYRIERYYEKSKKYYERVVVAGGTSDYPMIRYWQGKMLKATEEYDDAEFAFEKFLNTYTGEYDFYLERAKKEIEACRMAKRLKASPVVADIKNAGEEVNSAKSDFAAVQKDPYTIYFTGAHYVTGIEGIKVKGNGKGAYDSIPVPRIFSSEKNADAWEERELINIKYNNESGVYWMGTPSLTEDGQHMYVTIVEEYKGRMVSAIFKSKFDGSKWSKPRRLDAPVNEENANAKHPNVFIDGDGNEYLLYASTSGGADGGDYDLFIATIEGGKVINADNLGDVINTDESEESPFYNTVNNILYFSSKGHPGMGQLDVFMAHGNILESTWDSVVNLGYPINTGADDKFFFQTDSTEDGSKRMGFVSSNREGGLAYKAGTCCDDIYYYEWERPLRVLSFNIENVLEDKEYNGIEGGTVKIYNEKDSLLAEIKTNEEGEFSMKNLKPGEHQKLRVVASKDGYKTKSQIWDTKNGDFDDLDFVLEEMKMDSQLKDDKGEPIAYASVKVYDKDGNLLGEVTTDKDGFYDLSSIDFKGNRYVNIELSKKGYLTKSVKWDTNVPLNDANISSVLERIDLPIVYYEFDRFNLIKVEKDKMKNVVRYLNAMDETSLEIVSHTDNIGANAYNLRLSEKRTNYVIEHLVRNGIDVKRLKGKWQGEDKPLVSNKTRMGRDHNRRTQFGMIKDEELWAESGTGHIDFNMFDAEGNLIGETQQDDGSTPEGLDPVEEKAAVEQIQESSAAEKATGLYYKVQIGAFSDPGIGRFEHLTVATQVKVEQMNKIIYRFVVGEFTTMSNAEEMRQKMISEGIPDAWIVPYQDGARITMVKAKKLLENK